jgi:hypothetical protein
MTPHQQQQLIDAYIMQPVKNLPLLARTHRCTEAEAKETVQQAKKSGMYATRINVLHKEIKRGLR